MKLHSLDRIHQDLSIRKRDGFHDGFRKRWEYNEALRTKAQRKASCSSHERDVDIARRILELEAL